MKKISIFYQELFKQYGPQGWWPLLDHNGCNPTKTGSINGYHPGDYSFPKTDEQRFEICIGAILTQNTSWPNVEKALLNLKQHGIIDPKTILKTQDSELQTLIRPAGYYNQKARKLNEFSKFYIGLKGNTPSREQLLAIWGIGPETADSILLYAYKVPTFVVDTYTRRIFSDLKHIEKDAEYGEIKLFFENNLPIDYQIYQEFHALIVEHAKREKKNKIHG